MTSHHDVAGLLLRLRGRAHDAPMDHEHMMDEAIEALESAEASNTILWQINGQSSALIKTLVGQKTDWMDRALAAEARLAEATKALTAIAEHPKSYDDGKRSYAVGWAFWNVQNIARAFTNAAKEKT